MKGYNKLRLSPKVIGEKTIASSNASKILINDSHPNFGSIV